MSSESDKSTPKKAKDSLGWLTEPAKIRELSPRDSTASMLSNDSYNPSEVGEAIELSVVDEQRGHVGPVKQTYVQNAPKVADIGGLSGEKEAAEDEDSLFSSSTVHLGRLDTIKSTQNPRNPPEITVSTSIEEVVPPRSRRRPVSEIITSSEYPQTSQKGHRHRFSLNISDDLDKLMETASVLTDPSSEKPVMDLDRNVSRSTFASVSKESFQTADDSSLEANVALPQPLPKVPRRPNAQNLSRARQVSASHAQSKATQKEHGDMDQIESVSLSSDSNSARTWHADTPEKDDVLGVSGKPEFETPVKLKRTLLAQDTGSFAPGPVHNAEGSPCVPPTKDDSFQDEIQQQPLSEKSASNPADSAKPGIIPNPRLPSEEPQTANTDSFLPPNHGSINSTQSWTRSIAPASSKYSTPDLESNRPTFEARRDTQVTYSDIPEAAQVEPVSAARDLRQLPSKTGETSALASTLPPANEPSEIDSQRERVNSRTQKPISEIQTEVEPEGKIINTLEDDGFSDIEEPVVISHPARAKSVKESTKLPRRKGSRRKTRRSKQRDSADSGAHLKPFSYDTLVHLLESMNGTVIGEEFQSLNLPIREKQLIEKVIDSLSRLTSDMVTDKNRFDIGIERLEKAHRVLEGFL